MNIAFFGNYRTDVVNGVWRSGFFLATALTRLGANVFFYYWGDADGAFTDAHGIHHRQFRAPAMPVLVPPSFRSYIIANADDIDLFHFHSVFIPAHYGLARLLHQQGIPYVVTPHGGYNRLSLQRTFSTFRLLKQAYAQSFERFIVQHAHGMIAVAAPEVKDIEAIGARCAIRVIHNPVPPVEGLVPPPEHTRVALLYLGRYDIAFKSLDFMLQTFRGVRQAQPETALILHGEGKDHNRLLKRITPADEGHVHIGGPVFDDEKAAVIAEATLYFQPSRAEAFGMSLAEAMSLGKPVVITEESYLAPLLQKHRAGLIVPFQPERAASAILSFLQRRDLAEEGMRCREVVRACFDPGKIAGQTLLFYEEVLGRNTGKGFIKFAQTSQLY